MRLRSWEAVCTPIPNRRLFAVFCHRRNTFDGVAVKSLDLKPSVNVVFGFAITPLVVSLEVPHRFNELMNVMRGFLPFAACFAQFILIWFTHYRFSRRYGLEDAYTVLLNVVLLFRSSFTYTRSNSFSHAYSAGLSGWRDSNWWVCEMHRCSCEFMGLDLLPFSSCLR
jgi:hypothetical protein